MKNQKLKNLKDSERYKIVFDELKEFNKLIENHKKILIAIGNL